MALRAPLPRRLRRAILPAVAAGLIAGTVALTSAPDATTSTMAAGPSSSFVAVTDTATLATSTMTGPRVPTPGVA